jgi:hypothetical protein
MIRGAATAEWACGDASPSSPPALGMIKLEMMVDGLPDYRIDTGRFDYASRAEAPRFH